MKKQLLAVTVAALFGFGIPAAQAATATSGFNVTVALTAACSISSAPTDVAFTYTSFQAGVSNSTGGNFQVTCTNALPYTFSLDSTTGTVIGLNYSLVAPAGGNGNGAAQSYQITGTMAAGQSGTCATSPTSGTCSGTSARTLTITY